MLFSDPQKNILKGKLKRRKLKKNKHKARLIVRNLPFETTEENLQTHFELFGEIEEIQLLKREHGNFLGCGFVQFKLVQKAAKARHHLNGKPFLNRIIECDWAVAKNKYQSQTLLLPSDVKKEPSDNLVDVTRAKKIKEENVLHSKEMVDLEKESITTDEHSELEDETEKLERPRVVSNDVNEGRTVFIKNVPFSATKEDVKQCMSQFGEVYYALICVDHLTEHSKGTAFVKYKVSILL